MTKPDLPKSDSEKAESLKYLPHKGCPKICAGCKGVPVETRMGRMGDDGRGSGR